MTLFELIRQISSILTPETNSFYDYVLHASADYGGFLRVQFCRRDIPYFRDREISPLDEAVVCFRAPFQEDYGSGPFTYQVEFQLFYSYDEEKDQEFCVSWSRELGYKVPYLFDFRTMTYKILEY